MTIFAQAVITGCSVGIFINAVAISMWLAGIREELRRANNKR
jgi:hypothetical protein